MSNKLLCTPSGKSEQREQLILEDGIDSGFDPEDGTSGLSIVAEFDELMKLFWSYLEDDVGDEFLEFAENQERCRLEWLKAMQECQLLKEKLEKANHEIGDCNNKLNLARKLLDQEKRLRRRAEEECASLEKQMRIARELLLSDKFSNRLPEETQEKLAFLNSTNGANRNSLRSQLTTIDEVNSRELNSTGSLLSEFSYTRSEDDLDATDEWTKPKKHRRSSNRADEADEPTTKHRRSGGGNRVVEINTSDKIIATTTLSVSKDGPITATSVIEAVPPDEPVIRSETIANSVSTSRLALPRQHVFIPRPVIRPDECGPCGKRIRFGKVAVRCRECKTTVHTECKSLLPVPCIPTMCTPKSNNNDNGLGNIAEYVPSTAPMVPSLLIYCINEIEMRGMNEIGLYRIPGSERDVKTLKEKLLKSRSPPSLSDVDVHVICGVVKDFLRSLSEPLITKLLWKDFIQTSEAQSLLDVSPLLYQVLANLPQANRDTLAYVILHLQHVAESRDCMMPVGNLAKIFAPTIIGYSSSELDPTELIKQTRQQATVMEYLLSIPGNYWRTFTDVQMTPSLKSSRILQQTPSTDSLQGKTYYFTPHGSRSKKKKKERFFGTPDK